MTEVLHSSSSSSSPSISTPTQNGALFGTRSFALDQEIAGEGAREIEETENKERRDQQQLSLIALLVTLLRKSFLMACKTTTGRQELCADTNPSSGGMDIGWPTNVRHVAHVTFDRFNGFLGLPVEFEPEVPIRAPSASATVFGVSTESMQFSIDSRGNSIPTILILMQRKLYAQGGLQAEGIFRINAGNGQEEYVREELNNRGTIPEGIDVYCLAGLIKAWFRELPKGVLDPISPEQIMQCQSADDCGVLVRLLPQTEATLLDWAINLMADVVQMEHANKMNSRNIAMVFAPNMTHMADPLTALMYAVQVMNFLKTLIEKTLKDREDSVVEQTSASHAERFDENGHQSPELHLDNSLESNDESDRLSMAGQEFDGVESTSVEGYLTPEDYSDESQACETPIKPYLRDSSPTTATGDSHWGQSSDSSQLNSIAKMNDCVPVGLAIGLHTKSKGISNLSRINSLTERIEAWR